MISIWYPAVAESGRLPARLVDPWSVDNAWNADPAVQPIRARTHPVNPRKSIDLRQLSLFVAVECFLELGLAAAFGETHCFLLQLNRSFLLLFQKQHSRQCVENFRVVALCRGIGAANDFLRQIKTAFFLPGSRFARRVRCET